MRRDEVEDKVLAAIARYELLEPGQRVLVAVSGGQDSVALLHALIGVADVMPLDLSVAHLNHGLRGEEADGDEAFVRELAARLGLPCHTAKADVRALACEAGASVEAAGRRARYLFLGELVASQKIDRVALGHTASDRVEGLLMNLMRGAGLEGLRGLPARRGLYVRPLIGVTRAETESYCGRKGLRFRVDVTNLDASAHRRNLVRLRLVPYLTELFGSGVEAALLRMAEAADEELAWTQPLVDDALERCRCRKDALSLGDLGELERGLRARVLRKAAAEAGAGMRTLTRVHIEALEALVSGGMTGAVVELPGGIAARRGYTELELGVFDEPGVVLCLPEVVLNLPGVTDLPSAGLRIEAGPLGDAPTFPLAAADEQEVTLDADRLTPPLTLRGRRPGDRIQPLGMERAKKLQDYLTDKKAPRARRDAVPLVIDASGRIAWIVGYGIAHWARVDEGTTRFLRLRAKLRDNR